MKRRLPSHPVFDLNVKSLTLTATLQDGATVTEEFQSDEISGHFFKFKDKVVDAVRMKSKNA